MMGRLEILFDVSLYAYLLATVVFSVWFFWRTRKLWYAGSGLLALGLACQTAFLIGRGFAGGRPPFANTFETLILLAACLALFFLISAKFFNTELVAPVAALVDLFVTLFAYLIMQDEIDPLVPALRNNFWLTVHVAFCFVSYAAFLLAYMVAVASLVKNDRHAAGGALVVALSVTGVIAAIVVVLLARTEHWEHSRGMILGFAVGGAVLLGVALWPLVGLLGRKLGVRERMPEDAEIQKTLYKMVALGFPFLTLGIITGSYWASQAWGRYWGWDDKEVASLITWLVFAVYLHLRFAPKWRGAWNAWIAVAGFWCVLFTYFGVNYLLSGLHAYG